MDRDPVQPRLGRGVWPPRFPVLVGPYKGVLSAILGGRPIAKQGDQGTEDAPVRVPVEALKVCL